jgi:galactose oxidase
MINRCQSVTILGPTPFLFSGYENLVGLRSLGVYSPRDNFWTRLPAMNEGRWYANCTTLGSGEILTSSGSYVRDGVSVAAIPQAWNPATGQFRTLSDAFRYLEPYPFIFADPTVSPSSTGIFFAGPGSGQDSLLLTTERLSTDGTGSWTDVGALSKYHFHGSAVMYRPGKIITLAGSADGHASGAPDSYDVVEGIDLFDTNPAWANFQPLHYARQSQNATLLPDGTVLVTGGHSGPGLDTPQDESDAVRTPELWDPDPMNPSQSPWKTLAASPVARVYHSTAVLLPDARILTTGGSSRNGETFSPP